MSEYVQMLLAICVLIVFMMLMRKFHTWKIKRASFSIVKDIKEKKAFDSQTAVDLPYSRRPVFRAGLRDFRPIALEHLVKDNVIGVTDEGMYYLKDKNGKPLNSFPTTGPSPGF